MTRSALGVLASSQPAGGVDPGVSDAYMDFPGTASNYWNAGAVTAPQIDTSLTLRWRFDNDAGGPQAYDTPVSMRASGALASPGFAILRLNSNGKVYAAGSDGSTAIPTVDLGAPDGSAKWVEWSLVLDNGSNSEQLVRWSADTTDDHTAVSWTSLSTVTGTQLAPFTPGGNWRLGALCYNPALYPVEMELRRAVMLIDGAVELDAYPKRDLASLGDDDFTSAVDGETYTLVTSGSPVAAMVST